MNDRKKDNSVDRNQQLVDELMHVVRTAEQGSEFSNPEREYLLRYFILHQDEPAISEMIDDYYQTFGSDKDA